MMAAGTQSAIYNTQQGRLSREKPKKLQAPIRIAGAQPDRFLRNSFIYSILPAETTLYMAETSGITGTM